MKRVILESRGFSLIEGLVAAALVTSVLAVMAQTVGVGVRQAAATRRAAQALSLAQAKLEDLRTEPWTYDEAGGPISSLALALAPGALDADVDGHVEALDAQGGGLADADDPGRAYRRRWSVSLENVADPDTLVIRVCVWAAGGAPAASRLPDACVSALRTRQP